MVETPSGFTRVEIVTKVLLERAFGLRAVKFLASERSAGKSIEFKGKSYIVEPIRPDRPGR